MKLPESVMVGRRLSINLEWNLVYRWLMAFTIGSGWLFRLRAYWFNRSLWLDEAAMANVVIQNPLLDLITRPLAYNHLAPVGFLAAVKLLVTWISESEKVLRLLPLGAGMLLPVAALWLGSMLFEKPLPRLVFVSLIAFSPILIFYSVEFKQYILDPSLSLSFLALGFFISRKIAAGTDHAARNKVLWLFAALGAAGLIGVWFSLPLVFFLAGVGMSLFVQVARQKRTTWVALLLAIGIGWLGSFALSIRLLLKYVADNQDLNEFWAPGYAPVLFGGWASFKWYIETGLAAVYLAFQEQGVSGPYYHAGWYYWSNIFIGMICLCGGLWIIARYKHLGLSLILSGAAAWIASSMRYYPLSGRLFLFVVPVVFLFAAGMIDFLEQKNIKYVDWLLALFLVGVAFIPSLQYFDKPYSFSEIRTVLPYMVNEIEPGKDKVAVSQWSMVAYEYYSPRFGLDNLGLHAMVGYYFEVPEFLQSVCAYPDHGRMWLVFSHRMPQAQVFLDEIRALTPQLDQYESVGAGVYLFDFSQPDVCGVIGR